MPLLQDRNSCWHNVLGKRKPARPNNNILTGMKGCHRQQFPLLCPTHYSFVKALFRSVGLKTTIMQVLLFLFLEESVLIKAVKEA